MEVAPVICTQARRLAGHFLASTRLLKKLHKRRPRAQSITCKFKMNRCNATKKNWQNYGEETKWATKHTMSHPWARVPLMGRYTSIAPDLSRRWAPGLPQQKQSIWKLHQKINLDRQTKWREACTALHRKFLQHFWTNPCREQSSSKRKRQGQRSFARPPIRSLEPTWWAMTSIRLVRSLLSI